MINGALCLRHSSSNFHNIQSTAQDNDVVNEVPVFGPGMHPKSLVYVTELEEGVCDGKTQFRAERAAGNRYYSCCQHHDDQLLHVICRDFCRPGIEIAQQYDFVALRNPSEGGIQRIIKVIFHIIR